MCILYVGIEATLSHHIISDADLWAATSVTLLVNRAIQLKFDFLYHMSICLHAGSLDSWSSYLFHLIRFGTEKTTKEL